jgi:hypothetical protein
MQFIIRRESFKPYVCVVGAGQPAISSRSLSVILIALHDVIQKFGYGLDARNEQMIAGASAGNVEQVSLGVIHLLEISVVTDSLDALLQGNDLVISSHHNYSAEFQTLGEVHGTDRDEAARCFHVIVKNLKDHARCRNGGARTI